MDLTLMILLIFLPLQVIGLITTNAKCLAGYDWAFSSIGQSPCDVAAELASVCVDGQFDLDPLDPGFVYAGPTQANQNSCRCSSVYYSLLSACGYCQGRSYDRWTIYHSNCTTVYVATYNQQIPDGVKVPAYAYQNISDTFDVTLARNSGGVESSRIPSTASSVITNTADSSSTADSNSGSSTTKNSPAIIGGVVGGIAGLGVLALTLWVLLRKRKFNSRSQTYNQSFQLDPTTDIVSESNRMLSFPPVVSSPGSPDSSQEPDLSKYSPSPSTNNPYRQNSPPFSLLTITPDSTGNGAHQRMSQSTGIP